MLQLLYFLHLNVLVVDPEPAALGIYAVTIEADLELVLLMEVREPNSQERAPEAGVSGIRCDVVANPEPQVCTRPRR